MFKANPKKMSKRTYFHRYLLIIKKIKATPYAKYEEIESFINKQFEYFQEQDEKLFMGISKRTFQRDVKEIKSLFSIDIEYSTKNKGYFINPNNMENSQFQRLMEAFDLINSLNLAEDLALIIHLEKRKPAGTENLTDLIFAIKNKLVVAFSYQKYWDDEISVRSVQPYALKEFKNRWYLLANDTQDGGIKSFGLDRLTKLVITDKYFKTSPTFNIEEMYRYCFGIMNADEDDPQEIILSFDPHQGKYIKSLPLHETQQILIDNDDQLRIHLKLFITHDFVMELLAHGQTVTVIQPQILIDKLKENYLNSISKYK